MYSRFSRLNTARGSGTGLLTIGPAKVKACKSLLEGKIKRSLVNLVGLEKTVTEMVTGCLRTMKTFHLNSSQHYNKRHF